MLDIFFNPHSIAVIGASHSEEKLGYKLLKNLLDAKYAGEIYPVNPDTSSILDLKVYDSVLSIKSSVALALISVKAEVVPQIFKELSTKKIQNAIIYSAGFDEIGNQGRMLQEEIYNLSKKNNIQILGPNCLGIISTPNNLNASFSANYPRKGKTAIISQSGALLTSMLDWAEKNNFGLSRLISLGNKMDLSEIEFLEYLKNDPETESIGIYLESFKNGQEFKKIVSEISSRKPVIILKPGKSDQAKIAVTSHTGAMAGSDEATNAALKQSGCIRANSIEEFYDLLKAFSVQKYPEGPELAIITNAGGPGVLATDKAEEVGLNIIPISPSIKNPNDVIGDALSDRYKSAIKTAINDKIQDAVLVILTPQAMTEIDKTAEMISDLSKKTSKPVFASFIGGEKVEEGIKILNDNHIPTFEFPENAVSSLKSLLNYIERKKLLNLPPVNMFIDENKKQTAKNIFNKYITGPLSTIDCFKIAKIYEIPCVNTVSISNNPTIEQLSNINFPVVLKIDKTGHKTKIGGVVKNINTESELKESIIKLSSITHNFIVQEQIENGIEVIIGAKKDPDFGHLLMFGMGGIYTEILKDVNFAVVPLSNYDALDLVRNTKVYSLISKNIYPVIKCLLSVSTMLSDFPQIQELDINPLIVHEKSSIAVDVKIKL